MATNATSGQETVAQSKTELRARWEGFEFRVPVPGKVRVENTSYGEESSEHVYIVSVEGGIPFDCTCPSWEYHNPEGGCKHMVAVENQPAVLIATDDGSTDDLCPICDRVPNPGWQYEDREGIVCLECGTPGI